MARKKKTGADDIEFMVIAESEDGTETRKKIEAMDPGAALSFALDTGRISNESVSYRIVPISCWRRMQRADRQARKTGKVVKLPKKRAKRRNPQTSCGLKRVPPEVERAYARAFEGG